MLIVAVAGGTGACLGAGGTLVFDAGRSAVQIAIRLVAATRS
jgi:hypothetical protein